MSKSSAHFFGLEGENVSKFEREVISIQDSSEDEEEMSKVSQNPVKSFNYVEIVHSIGKKEGETEEIVNLDSEDEDGEESSFIFNNNSFESKVVDSPEISPENSFDSSSEEESLGNFDENPKKRRKIEINLVEDEEIHSKSFEERIGRNYFQQIVDSERNKREEKKEQDKMIKIPTEMRAKLEEERRKRREWSGREDGNGKESGNNDGEDDAKGTKIQNRYFIEESSIISKILCNNCYKRGHTSYQCIEESIQKPCNLCGELGHERSSCPQNLCHNCCQPGHQSSKCKESKKSKNICYSCGQTGHNSSKCDVDEEIINESHNNSLVDVELEGDDLNQMVITCYNCGESGHSGKQCRSPRVHIFDNVDKAFRRKHFSSGLKKKPAKTIDDYYEEAWKLVETERRKSTGDVHNFHKHSRGDLKFNYNKKDYGKSYDSHHGKKRKFEEKERQGSKKERRASMGNTHRKWD
eukprot:TRINITY_DN11429_c0_g1_i1.p1 TRINITY_DN11429_c0_g1~~TRINITY_DN11429_c0_g1_i1.p1  ORF type:complete len:467 (-),score=147.19 TRINITY_DN11429_c0_g1_i1:107-1507(-)